MTLEYRKGYEFNKNYQERLFREQKEKGLVIELLSRTWRWNKDCRAGR
jgi:hypothetical protein